MRKHAILAALLLSLLATSSHASFWSALWPFKKSTTASAVSGIEFFSPQGTVKKVRQVTARFQDPMVPFGDPRGLLEPFTVNCPAKGSARWADSRNWVYDFDEDLPAGVQCDFTLKPDIKNMAGAPVAAEQAFSFNTGGPAILNSEPYAAEYSKISEDQIFILRTDAEANQKSVLENVYFSVDGIAEKIGVQIISGEQRQLILKEDPPYFLRNEPNPSNVILLGARQRFPAEAKVALVWGKGVSVANGGIATTQDQVLHFIVRPEFTVSLNCERVNAESGCLPFKPITLNFSAPTRWEQAQNLTLNGPKGQQWKAKPGNLDNGFVSWASFEPPFPPSSKFKVTLTGVIQDDANRPLFNRNKFPLSTEVGAYPPLAKFPAHFGILEANGDPVLPFTVRNIEPQVKMKVMPLGTTEEEVVTLTGEVTGRFIKTSHNPADIMPWMQAVNRSEFYGGKPNWNYSIFSDTGMPVQKMDIPKPNGDKAFEVMGIPLKQPGIYIAELESRILGNALYGGNNAMYAPAMALVTNLSVHLKWGHESSLVWVTSLDKGKPVPNAKVEISNCAGKKIWEGQTDEQGTVKAPPLSARPEGKDTCLPGLLSEYAYSDDGARLFVGASLGEDFSFVISNWNDGIEPWRFNIPSGYHDNPDRTLHTVFDRMLLRAGETVHMKHFFRTKTAEGFAVPATSTLTSTVTLMHVGTEEKFEFPLSWSASGTAETTWDIPKEAKLGLYAVLIGDIMSGTFRVEEFRVPLMRGTIQTPRETAISSQTLRIGFAVNYLSGGAAGGLPVKLRTQLQSSSAPEFDAFEGFTFANGPAVAEGRENQEQPVRTTELNLDANGTGKISVGDMPAVKTPMKLSAELEFHDPNGEIQTVSSRIPVWPSQWLVGLKPDSWAMSKKTLKFHAAVTDINGKPVSGVPLRLELFQRKTFSHRRRLVGGFYSYQHSNKLMNAGPVCPGVTDSHGRLICEAPAPVSGNIIVQASATDPQGKESVANTDIWVADGDEWWFSAENNDRMDMLPEKKQYEPGQTASFQVRMPFKEATALITVEREGVLDTYVQTLTRKKPVINIPVKGSYSPNVFVSVLAVRSRVGDVQPTALVDLGRPAYKMGVAEINVGWKAHELKVSVRPQRKTYKIREKALTSIAVLTVDGTPLPAGAEVTVAAVDEGLLELMPNTSWKLLEAMMGRRSNSVETATAQMQVIGKRHYGLKALPQGGGGGRTTTRELFDTLLLWKATLPLNEQGRAEVEIPLNDSITAFKIVAIATAGPDRFGTGSSSIRTTQDLSIFSGLAPVVREGDRYRAYFTVRNATAESSTVTLSANIDGLLQQPAPLTAVLNPNEAKELSWDLDIPRGTESLKYTVLAKDNRGNEDRIQLKQTVKPAVPVRVFQATIYQLDGELEFPVRIPQDALRGPGHVQVLLQPSLADGTDGIEEYMRGYPFPCMEQQVSQAVALKDEDSWKRLMSRLPSYLDADGFVKYFTTCGYGSEVLTAYVLAIANEAGWEIPAAYKYRMKEALYAFLTGRVSRISSFPTADLTIRKLSALEALSRYNEGEIGRLESAMSSITKEPNLWPTSAVLDWSNILKRVSPDKNKSALNAAETILRSRLNFQGTTMGFSTEESDRLWWLMVSNDINAVRMVLNHIKDASWREDMPRLLRGALGRQKHGHWDLTLANAWGRLAMDKFAAELESEPVTGRTEVTIEKKADDMDWNKYPGGGTLKFAWPEDKEDLDITHRGSGKPWATITSYAAIPLTKPFSSGYKIKKSWIPVEQKVPGIWSRGDVIRVRLELESQSDMTWVAVNDPVPSGVTILGSGLGSDSSLLTQGERQKGWVWPAYEERTFDSFRSYFEYVPKGSWTVEYTIRLNNEGRFSLPATRVEAMYAPEMFGESPNETIEIKP